MERVSILKEPVHDLATDGNRNERDLEQDPSQPYISLSKRLLCRFNRAVVPYQRTCQA